MEMHQMDGYTKKPDDPRFWVIDPEAADAVRCIYRLALEENAPCRSLRHSVQLAAYLLPAKGSARAAPKAREPTKWSLPERSKHEPIVSDC